MSELDAEIDSAIAHKEYDRSALLGREKELRTDIREALKYDDFKRADKLKKQLDQLYESKSEIKTSSVDSGDLNTNDKTIQSSKTENKIPSGIKSGFYIEGITALGIFRMDYASPGGGISMGAIKYLYQKNPKLNFGIIGQSSFSYYFLDENFMSDIIQFGPYMATSIGKNKYFEFGIINGLTLESEFIEDFAPSFDLGTILKLRISNFSIGMDFDLNIVKDYEYYYNYQTNDFDEISKISSILRFGLKVGGKF